MDKIWNYKNFNMVNELDIAGEFIYDGIQTLNQMDVISDGASIFSFLYHVAVGIERLQKILIVLFEDITFDNYEKFEKSIKIHRHNKLHERISKTQKITFDLRECDFLDLLTTFYKESRYNRFNLNSPYCQEKEIMEKYITKYLDENDISRSVFSSEIIVNHEVRELFGSVIGKISTEYYKVLRDIAGKKCTYTYELRSDSKAQKVFLSGCLENSLQEMKITETIALKEFLVFLKNTKESTPFTRFLKTIQPLEMDTALINEYIMEIGKGTIPQALVDEVEYLYEENGYGKDRIEQINLIGDPYVMFEYGEIFKCIEFAESFLSAEFDAICFARKFPTMVLKIKDDDFTEFTASIRGKCKKFKDSKISEEELGRCVKNFVDEAKAMYHCHECSDEEDTE